MEGKAEKREIVYYLNRFKEEIKRNWILYFIIFVELIVIFIYEWKIGIIVKQAKEYVDWYCSPINNFTVVIP